MKSIANRLATVLARTRTVAVADCVHFCAYRYGRSETNPYERYIESLVAGLPVHAAREQFVEYLRGYRPRHLGEALGANLSKSYPLWHLPWRTPAQVRRSPGWPDDPGAVVDVMTYFSEAGIPVLILEKEFQWHEEAFAAIAKQGYQPRRYGYITARELRGERSAYLVTDGNHRLSAMSALGQKEAVIKLLPGSAIVRQEVAQWPLVKAGIMLRDDALAVFDAYLHGNTTPVRSDRLANVISKYPPAKPGAYLMLS